MIDYMTEDRESGFSLVELLVVIVIIGILSAIAIGAFLNQRQKVNDAAVESDMRNMLIVTEPLFLEYYDPSKDASGFAKQIDITGSSSAQFKDPEHPAGSGTVEIRVKNHEGAWENVSEVHLSDGVKAVMMRHKAENDDNPATTNDGYAIWMYHVNGGDHTLESPLRWTNQIGGGGGYYELPGD